MLSTCDLLSFTGYISVGNPDNLGFWPKSGFKFSISELTLSGLDLLFPTTLLNGGLSAFRSSSYLGMLSFIGEGSISTHDLNGRPKSSGIVT